MIAGICLGSFLTLWGLFGRRDATTVIRIAQPLGMFIGLVLALVSMRLEKGVSIGLLAGLALLVICVVGARIMPGGFRPF